MASLFLLLLLSFIYTDKVFSSARENDPIMKDVIEYKKNHDIKPVEPKIHDDEIILGISGLVVNEKESYSNMKGDDKFDKTKIVYDNKLPKTTITKNFNYYITKGNKSAEKVAIIFKVSSMQNIDSLLSMISKTNVKVNFFIDGAILEKNVETAFSMVNLDCEIYNLGYDSKYTKNMISVTNNLIESITLKDANFCLNENKDDSVKKMCAKKKMYTISPSVINPNITELKKELDKGQMIVYDADDYDYSYFNLMINTITSRGYVIVGLSDLIKE